MQHVREPYWTVLLRQPTRELAKELQEVGQGTPEELNSLNELGEFSSLGSPR